LDEHNQRKSVYTKRYISWEGVYFEKFNKEQIYGGLIFDVGRALTGASPGPINALIGAGKPVVIATLIRAIAGTWVY